MKRFKARWSVTLLLAAICFPLLGFGLGAETVYKKVSDSIFTLYSLDFQTKAVKARGSAVAIKNNVLATNCHVALGGNYVVVSLPDDRSKVARIFYIDQKQDLCLLEVPNVDFHPVTIRPSSSVDIGEEVFAIGNPKGTEKTLSQGIISNKHKAEGGVLLQTDATIYFGSSGGGLFDKNGNLIGITTKMGGNFGLAIPTEWVTAVLSPDQSKVTVANSTDDAITSPRAELTQIGTYGKDQIGLYRNNKECFLLIPGRDSDGKVKSSTLWNPKYANTLVVFLNSNNGNKAMEEVQKAYLDKKTKDQSNYESKSKLHVGKHTYSLYGTKTDGKSYPFLITQFPTDPEEVFRHIDEFKVDFNDTQLVSSTAGQDSVVFTLNGFEEAMSAFDANCE